MKEKLQELCSDPLFHINLTIWLTQPKPDNFSIQPVLYQSGFRIFSIGPLLSLPPDIRLMTRESNIECQDVAKPDLILEADNRSKLLIMECKKSSFGSSSSTSGQARTLLLLSGPVISEVLAIGKRSSAQGILCYFTRSEQVSQLENTLSTLEQEIQKANLDSGEYGCLGIGSNDTAIFLTYSDKMRQLLRFQSPSPLEILSLEDGTDPRPLYFIPYDPSIEQSREEQALSRRILYERFLSNILTKIGPVNAPCEVVLKGEEILRAATFGLYDIWEDAEARKHIRRLWRDFMDCLRNSLKEEQRNYIKYKPDKGWILTFENRNVYEEMLTQVSKFKPEFLDLSKPMETPQLELELPEGYP
ncbi:MAG: hypothetical protein ABSH06_09045 [Thermodesulfobacteriota bacterium]|jgi:hypothetical protein